MSFSKDRIASQKYNEARRRTANNELRRLTAMGCYNDDGTDVKISGSEVYGSFWWPIARSAVMERDSNKCQLCGSTELLEVHHVMPRHLGGSDHPFNLVTLCRFCHDRVHANSITETARFCKSQMRIDNWSQIDSEEVDSQ